MEKKKYYKKNNKNNYNNYHKKTNKDNIPEKKLTYDDIVNVRDNINEVDVKKDSVKTYRFVAISVILLTIIFASLLLFRVI